jgi:hypothetical protein
MVRNVRWSITAHHNLPILREVSRSHGHSVKAFLTPVTHRNRIHLWILAAGMLDAARYLNLRYSKAYTVPAEREIYGELADYIIVNYKKDMYHFRAEFNEETDNFAKSKEIKKALYEVVMSLPKNRVSNVSPFWVLHKGLNRFLTERGEPVTK